MEGAELARVIVNGGLARRTRRLKGFSSDLSRLVNDRALWRQRRSRDFEVDDRSARLELSGRMSAYRPSLRIKGYLLDYGERWMRRNPTAERPYAIDVQTPGVRPDAPVTSVRWLRMRWR